MSTTTSRGRLADAAQLLVLWNFAVAQPLFDLLGRQPTFFAVRRSEPIDLVLLAVILAFVAPGLLVLLEEGARRLHARAQALLHALLVGLLGTVLALQGLSRLPALPVPVTVTAALVVGVVLPLALRRAAPLAQVCLVLAPTPLLFAGLFLFQVRSLILEPPDPLAGFPRVQATDPIVMLVFDEFNGAWLTDETGRLDAGRYPNLAALARDGIWFRNATTVSPATTQAVPAILTGRMPDPSGKALPNYATHPQNLFTLLGATYRLEVLETISSLCPEALCEIRRQPLWRRLEALATDLGVVFLHVALTPDLTRDLPAVTAAWGSFAGEGKREKDERMAPLDRLEEWMARITDGPEPGLFFAHLVLPHVPWRYFPSGRMYEGRGDAGHVEGLDPIQGVWADDEWLVTQALQRYLLQVGAVDRAVGRVVERLKREGLYERALIVVTADHGVSFRPGEYRRLPTRSNAADIMMVPLIIKAPRGPRGVVSDRNVQSVDILPTIADLLDVDLPWPVDGVSAVDPAIPEPSRKVVMHPHGEPPLVFGRTVPGVAASVARVHRLFGTGEDLGPLYRIGRYASLIGRPVEDLPVADRVDLEMELDWADAYAEVDTDGREVPANVKGWLVGARPDGDVAHLAVALNGRVAAVTRTAPWRRGRARFAALVPESALRDGYNEVEVFALSGPVGSPRLATVGGGAPRTYTLVAGPDGERIVRSDGRIIPIRQGVEVGQARLLPRDGGLAVSGWAVDLARERPAAAVLVFVGRTFGLATGTGRAREDVVERYGASTLLESGFGSQIPWHLLDEASRDGVRIFAVLADGTAGELVVDARALGRQAVAAAHHP